MSHPENRDWSIFVDAPALRVSVTQRLCVSKEIKEVTVDLYYFDVLKLIFSLWKLLTFAAVIMFILHMYNKNKT